MNAIWFWSIVATIVLIGVNILIDKAIEKANKKKRERFKNGRNNYNDNGDDGNTNK